MTRQQYNFYVYILSSESGALYIGITNDLQRRIEEHTAEINESFTKKYKCKNLVYYEHFNDVRQAIQREKEIKKWRREKKIKLINSINPKWDDMYRGWAN